MRTGAVLVLLLCVGQAGAQVVSPPSPVTLLDARPAEQKKTKFESLTVWRCMYASQRIGDDDEGVQRIRSLQSVLDGLPSLAGKTVTVTNYVVHFNAKQAARRNFATNMRGGAIAGAAMPSDAPGEVVGCAKDDLQGGYTSNEIPLAFNPIVTVIDLAIGGRAFHFRSISDTDTARFGNRADEQRNYRKAHEKTLADLEPALARFLQQ